MKRVTKIVLSLVLMLGMVVLPLCAGAVECKADEPTEGTQGILTAVNYYDYNFGPYQDFVVFACSDSTQTLLTLTGQDDQTFAWWYNFVIEYNAEKGTWVVTKADMVAGDGVIANCNEPLGEGKMVIMFHDLVADREKESYDFFLNTVEVGREYYLGIHPSYMFDVYDKVEGAFLSTVPVEVPEPEPEPTESEVESEKESQKESEKESEKDSQTTPGGNDDKKGGINPLVIVVVVVAVVAVAGGVVLVIKRKGAK